MRKLLQERKIINILKEYNNKYGVLLEGSKLDILTDEKKFGMNKEVATVFDEVGKKLAIWLANKYLKFYYDEGKKMAEKDIPNQQILEWAKERLNRLIPQRLREGLIPIMDYIQVGLNGNKSSLDDLSIVEIMSKQQQWHDSLGIGEGNINYIENAPILIDFRNEDGEGYYWADLNVKNSPEECERMGHCGRSSYGYLYSLRSDKKLPGGKYKLNRSHLTASIGTDGILYQLKGPKNSKPKEEYHKYILPLFYAESDSGEGDYLIQGFGTEYATQQDFKLTDLPDQTIRELYRNRPELFNTRGLQRKLGEMGIVEVEPLQTTFTLEIEPKDVGDYLSGDYVYRTIKAKKPSEYDKKVYFYEAIMSDDVWDMWDNYDVDWKSSLEYYVDSTNEKKIEDLVDNMIKEQGAEVDESMSLKDKIEEYDTDYNIRNAISDATNDAERNSYVEYLRDGIYDALNELGNVYEFTYDRIKIQIDLKDFNLNEDELDEYYENCNDNPACVFRELVSEGNIDLPKPRFDDRWYPDVDKKTFNEYLRDRLSEI
jgi:hypothetical protein